MCSLDCTAEGNESIRKKGEKRHEHVAIIESGERYVHRASRGQVFRPLPSGMAHCVDTADGSRQGGQGMMRLSDQAKPLSDAHAKCDGSGSIAVVGLAATLGAEVPLT